LKTLEEFINNLNKNEKHKEKFKKFTEELARVQKILTSGAAKVTHKNQ
jgi:hypothetical protein